MVQARFLLISDAHDMTELQEAMRTLGALDVVPEDTAQGGLVWKHYALIMLDATSVQDGPELISRIRQQAPEVKIIVATASPGWSSAREMFRAGATDSIGKAVGRRELLRTLVSILTEPVKTPHTIRPEILEKPLKPQTILVADPDVERLYACQKLLQQAGYQVLAAPNTQMTRQLLLEDPIDLAILDIRLNNGHDEYDLSGLLTACDVAPDVPKIIMSGFPVVDHARRAYHPYLTGKPGVDFLSRHAPLEIILHTVRAVLSRPEVLLVHGYDERTASMVRDFLDKGGLHVLRLQTQPVGGQTIRERLAYYTGTIDLAVVLLIPDEVREETSGQVKPQVWQNVMATLDYFLGKLGHLKVIPLYKAGVELPSTLAGLLPPILLDRENGWKLPLVHYIQQAGLAFDLVKAVL